MGKATKELRELWRAFECNEDAMELVPFGPDRIRVAPGTGDAWLALAAVLKHHGYQIRTKDTDSYNCRDAKGGGKSLHSFGIALDVNWNTNPYIDHAGERETRFSTLDTQDQRAEEQRLGRVDTDMTPAMIADIRKIATVKGVKVFEWGGDWHTVKDCMHFELDLSPEDLAAGIDWATCVGASELAGLEQEHGATLASTSTIPVEAPVPATAASQGQRFTVNARGGLKMRSGPGLEFSVISSFAAGQSVFVLERSGDWAKVDLEGDGLVDGFMFFDFLKPAGATPTPQAGSPSAPAAPSSGDLDRITVRIAKAMFPATKVAAIEANLPHVLVGLHNAGLHDSGMGLMALATIRAETEGFRPIDEGQSRFNTRARPFDLYDAGTSIGRVLGNTVAGDGPRFKGRGYVQLTGRSNYTRIGGQLGVDLVGNPALANDPVIAGRILAQFLKNVERRLRDALRVRDLKAARKLINGGSHGLDRFTDAYDRGEAALG